MSKVEQIYKNFEQDFDPEIYQSKSASERLKYASDWLRKIQSAQDQSYSDKDYSYAGNNFKGKILFKIGDVFEFENEEFYSLIVTYSLYSEFFNVSPDLESKRKVLSHTGLITDYFSDIRGSYNYIKAPEMLTELHRYVDLAFLEETWPQYDEINSMLNFIVNKYFRDENDKEEKLIEIGYVLKFFEWDQSEHSKLDWITLNEIKTKIFDELIDSPEQKACIDTYLNVTNLCGSMDYATWKNMVLLSNIKNDEPATLDGIDL